MQKIHRTAPDHGGLVMSGEWLTGAQYWEQVGHGRVRVGARVLVDGRAARITTDPYWGFSGPVAKFDDLEESYALNLGSSEVLIHRTEVQKIKVLNEGGGQTTGQHPRVPITGRQVSRRHRDQENR